MEIKMKISVIIPMLSGEIYLQDCTASVNAQSCGLETEIIIEEDDKNSPKGVAAMRNLGLEAASGDFVFFLDSDDYISDNAFEVLAAEAEKHPDSPVALNFKKTWYKRDSELAEVKAQDAANTQNGADTQNGANTQNAANTQSGPDTQAGAAGNAVQAAAIPRKAEKTRSLPDSVLGILIPAKYVKGRDALRFDESLKFYSDIPFMTALTARAGEIYTVPEYPHATMAAGNPEAGAENATKTAVPCVYYKRSRNDAIRYPALCQIKDKNRYAEFARACGEADAAASTALYEYICGFICDKLTKGKHPEGLEWNGQQLESASDAVRLVPREVIEEKYTGAPKRILLKLKKGKTKSAQRTAKLHVMNRKKKGLFGSASQWKWNIYKRIFRKLPVKKNLYLFESFLGKSYGDSCRAIYEYMIAAGNKNAKYVWIIDNKDAKIPGKHKEAKPLSLKYFYYVARCGAWINNMRQPAWYEKREGVRFLETWHGTPLKKLVFDMEDVHSASPEYKMTFYKQSRIWDWLVSDNRFSTDAFESAFLFPRDKILELGYPRNDLLYGSDRDERAAAIRRKLGIPEDKKVVLYAPTWRDDDYYGPGQYKFDLPLDLDMMEQLKDEYFFILRTHYFIADHLQLDESKKSFVKDCSRYNDIGELYLISDVLITDYSSVFFDYANLRRPILFYVYDFEKYRDTLRGFYFDMESGVPGPLLYTNEKVLAALRDIDGVEKKYADKYRAFAEKFCGLDDGHAAGRVVKAAFEEFR